VNNMDSAKRKPMGRGLSALFGEQEETVVETVAAPPVPAAPKPVSTFPVDMLAPSPLQPRHHFDEAALDELAASIAEKGVLQPLLIRPDPANPGRYEIIAGERRWRVPPSAHRGPGAPPDRSPGCGGNRPTGREKRPLRPPDRALR
jgi:ParB family chromosome partitioning protein